MSDDLLTPDDIVSQAIELAKASPAATPHAAPDGEPNGAVEALWASAGGSRPVLEAARDQVATRIHHAVDDWDATAALTLLNRSLSELPRHDPLDWRIRWTQRFRRP